MNNAYQKKTGRERGIALVLALLLTGTVTAAALIIAALLVRELRLTDNIRKSLVAYYGAESGLESALYEYYQSGQISFLQGDVGTAKWQISSNPSKTEMEVPLPWERTKEIPLYNVVDSNIFGVREINFCWSNCAGGPGQLQPPVAIEWTLLTLSVDGMGTWLEPGPRGSRITKGIINCVGSNAATLDLADQGLSPADRHILRFKHIDGAGGNTVSFHITMTDAKGAEVAFNQETAFKVTGTATGGEISRALEVALPLKPPAYDVFDYVIFSDTHVGK